MECSRTSLLVLFPFSSDEALQAASPSPAAPIPVTRYCSHAGISNRFPLGARAGDAGGWWGVALSHPRYYLNYFSAGPGSKVPLQVIIMLTHQPEDSSRCISR